MRTAWQSIWRWMKRTGKGFLDHNCGIHAAGLTYFAMLAVIPVLCCILAVAKIARVDHYAKTQINAQIDALIVNIENGQDEVFAAWAAKDEADRGRKRIAAKEFAQTARKLSDKVFGRVARFDAGAMGWAGVGLLVWTVISSLGTVEISFNQIWGVPKPRPVWKRAYVYLFIIVVMPVLAAIAMSLPVLNAVKNVIVATLGATWLTQWASDGIICALESWVARGLFTLAASSLTFGFFFWAMPNCRVVWRHAWWGGLCTAVLFGGWVKLCAVAQVGIARSSALYGSFAFLPIVLAWLYVSWQIVLLGANMVKAFGEK